MPLRMPGINTSSHCVTHSNAAAYVAQCSSSRRSMHQRMPCSLQSIHRRLIRITFLTPRVKHLSGLGDCSHCVWDPRSTYHVVGHAPPSTTSLRYVHLPNTSTPNQRSEHQTSTSARNHVHITHTAAYLWQLLQLNCMMVSPTCNCNAATDTTMAAVTYLPTGGCPVHSPVTIALQPLRTYSSGTAPVCPLLAVQRQSNGQSNGQAANRVVPWRGHHEACCSVIS